MLESVGHSNAFTKSSELERGPIIRYFAGECGLFSTWLSKDSFVIFSHHVWKGWMYFVYLWYNLNCYVLITSVVFWKIIITKIITCAKLMKNIWSLVYFCRPGKACSVSPAISLLRNFLYARKPSLRPPLSAMFSPCVLMPFNFGWNEIDVYKILEILFYDNTLSKTI